jgi:hypothetical protein
MTDRVSFIGPAEGDEINAAFRQLFATSLELANPPVMVQVYRGTAKVGSPTQVQVVPANRQSRQASDGGALNVAFDGGVLRAWAPWDIDTADRVRIGDATAVIRSTPPIRNGIQDATYEMEGGGGTNG